MSFHFPLKSGFIVLAPEQSLKGLSFKSESEVCSARVTSLLLFIIIITITFKSGILLLRVLIQLQLISIDKIKLIVKVQIESPKIRKERHR